MRCGENSGCEILRYFTWSGGSICSGMSGRTLPRSAADIAEEKISGRRSTSSTSDRLLTRTPTRSTRSIGEASRSSLYEACGWRDVSGSMASSRPPSVASPSPAPSMSLPPSLWISLSMAPPVSVVAERENEPLAEG